ncbi:MAG TPA: hypothetical protein VFK05_07385 [Polyangiaceae bacterium]|nr:hypothetical protein [Polyangiaceae bacterium]
MTSNAGRFAEFTSSIRPTDSQQEALKDAHHRLRDRLREYEPVAKYLVSTFLQGSYRRSTAVRPTTGRRSDVDIVVVTKLHESEFEPKDALSLFEDFARKFYAGKYRLQGRSIGITMSNVDMDLVINSAPSEALIGLMTSDSITADDELEDTYADWRLNEAWVRLDGRDSAQRMLLLNEAATRQEWQMKSLRIPNRDVAKWEDTHPLEQLQRARDKNKATSGHFLNVVKAVKWWRYRAQVNTPHPKGYPLERIVTEYCPDGIDSIAKGFTETLENIAQRGPGKPFLANYGTNEDVLKRVVADDYRAFHSDAERDAIAARRALDEPDQAKSAMMWREFFGPKFPDPPEDASGGSSRGGFSDRTGPSNPGPTRYA